MKLRKLIISAAVTLASAVCFGAVSAQAVTLPSVDGKYSATTESIKITLNSQPRDNEEILERYVYVDNIGYSSKPANTTFKKTGLKPGKDYTFSFSEVYRNKSTGAVRAALSKEVKLCTQPETPVIESMTATDTTVKIQWKKQTASSGFKVYAVNKDGTLKWLASIRSNAAVSYVVKGLDNLTEYSFGVKAYKNFGTDDFKNSAAAVGTVRTLKHPEAATSKDKPGIIELKKDTMSLPDSAGNSVMVRAGFYSGYKKNAGTYVVAVGYGGKAIPYTDANIDVKYVNNEKHTILSTGSISQYQDGKDYPNGCGPTSVDILINHELRIPNGDPAIGKNTLISMYRNDDRVKKFCFATNYWCISEGTYNKGGVSVIVDDFAKEYGRKAVYFDTGTINAVSNYDRRIKIMEKIDSELAKGHRVLACVSHTSDRSTGLTTHDYVTGEYTHCIVITAETSSTGGYYFIADSVYSEAYPYAVNGNKYYYGLTKALKSDIAKAVMRVEGIIPDDELCRGLVFIK